MAGKVAPLNASFMLTAILGFLISVVYVRKVDLSWSLAFAIVFLIMIIAALISMMQAPVKGQLMPRLERDLEEPKFTFEQANAMPAKSAAQKKKSAKRKPARKSKPARKKAKKAAKKKR